MATTKTWNYKSLKISFNGAAITDLNGDATVTADGEAWEFVEGQNGYVERNLLDNHLATVTLPIHATNPSWTSSPSRPSPTERRTRDRSRSRWSIPTGTTSSSERRPS